MNFKELDCQLLGLQEQYNTMDTRYGEIQDEMEELEYEQEILEDKMNIIEKRIADIKKKMLVAEIDALNVENNDKFTMDFIRASYFAAISEGAKPILQTVNITETELQACDGYRAIIIKNNEIPKEFQNTKIMWNVRGNFKENTNKIKGDFIKLDSIFPNKKENKYTINEISSETFDSYFKTQTHGNANENIVKLFYEDFSIAFNREYLNCALTVLKNSSFTVSFSTNVKPMLLENKDIKIIILPVRLTNY